MAKIGTAIDSSAIPKKLKRIIKHVANQPALCARFTTKLHPHPNTAVVQMSINMTHAVKGWQRLSAWKKYRWSLCAWRKGLSTEPPIGWVGWSGMALYFQCRAEQNTPADKQPISPCSARITNPLASPWNYLP